MARQQFEIIVPPLVERLHMENVPLPEPPYRSYPDGSLWVNDHGPGDRIRGILAWESGGYGIVRWRALAPFGDQLYCATYPGWYNVMLRRHDESGVCATPSLNPVSKEELDLGHIGIMVQLHRKFSKEMAEDLAHAVRNWFEEVGSKGVFGEHGASSLSPVMSYLGKDASFEIDISESGQDTLNTLVLAILNWAMSTRRPLYCIAMAIDEYEPVLKSQLSVSLGRSINE
jgi:hypothetical protein